MGHLEPDVVWEEQWIINSLRMVDPGHYGASLFPVFIRLYYLFFLMPSQRYFFPYLRRENRFMVARKISIIQIFHHDWKYSECYSPMLTSSI